MSYSVSLEGAAQARRSLSQLGRNLNPVMRGTLNTTATQTRNQRYISPMRSSIRAQRLRRALVIKRANSRRMEAMIIPSSSGIPVLNYRSWGMDQIDATRARIWVRGPSGKKTAAGFINPASRGKLPWSTYSSKTTARRTYRYSHGLQTAIGLSAAFWFRQLTDSRTLNWISDTLQHEFARRLERELTRSRT